MNRWFIGAALLSGLTAVAHVFGGGPEFHKPMMASALSDPIRAGFSVVWHATTIMLVVNTGLLIRAALDRSEARALAWVVILQYLPFAGLFLYFGLMRLGNITALPQWSAFLIVSVLALIGLRKRVSI